MDLPAEICDKIYDKAMAGEFYGPLIHKINKRGIRARIFEDPVELRQFLRNRTYNDTVEPGFVPAVCRVSRAMQRETVNRFISNSTFFVCSIEDNQFLQAWLNNVPNGLASVRSLHFDFFGCFPSGFHQNADLELAACCPGLIDIKFAFLSKSLRAYGLPGDDGWRPVVPRSTAEMWS